jgi:DNA-binding NtrC family response regulator
LGNYNGRLLLVDDDEKILTFYTAVFEKAGYVVATCKDLGQMRDCLQGHSYDGVFLDLNLGRENGIDGLPYVLKAAPYAKVFILTSQHAVDKAVECMKRGADWYFTKGTEPQDLLAKIKEIIGTGKTGEADATNSTWQVGMVGDSKAMRETCAVIEKLKEVDSTILILGESGTGKEVVARAIHQASKRNNARFEAINCGAIPENLLESELFGHKKGSFTDAKADRKGIFEVCSKGTLLLDEIGDMPLSLQTKLLRVLQEKQIQAVGSSTTVDIDTRVIAATHRNVMDEIKSNRFREDLYYRLSVVILEIPALRHRKEDIPLLVKHFLDKFNQRFDKQVSYPAQSVIARLQSYDWPGNIRELQNSIERGVVLSGTTGLTIENMFSHLHSKPTQNGANDNGSSFTDHKVFDLPLTEAKQAFEKAYLDRLLKKGGGNVAELARQTGRYRADLYRMLERYQIKVEDYRHRT